MPTTLLGRIGESSRTSARAHRWPVNRICPNGWPSIWATVRASGPAVGSPSTTPKDIPLPWAKRAIRTRDTVPMAYVQPVTDVLPADVWRARQAAHEARVDAWIGPHLARRRDGVPHPV